MLRSARTWLVRSVPLLITAGLLLAAEGIVRLTMAPDDAVRFFMQGGLHAHDAHGARTFMGDPDLGWKLRPGLDRNAWLGMPVTTTHDGFRADREFPRPKRGPRVLCVGDSVTFGYGILSPVQVYPGILEHLLRGRPGTAEADVVPMGVPAYSSFQGRLWLEEQIDTLDPDLVTILYGFNDASPGRSDRLTLSRSWLRRSARALVYGSQALTHLLIGMRPLLEPNPGGPPPAYHPRVTTNEYLDNIKAMVDLARGRGARVVVIAQVYREPHPQRPDQDRMIDVNRRALESACTAWDVPFLEIPLLTEAKAGENEPFFVDREHPSPLGHRLLAERLYDLVIDRGLLPSPQTAASPGS